MKPKSDEEKAETLRQQEEVRKMAAGVLARVAEQQSADPESDDLTVSLAIECAEIECRAEHNRRIISKINEITKEWNDGLQEANGAMVRIECVLDEGSSETKLAALDEIEELKTKIRELRSADDRIGFWLSAVLDDPNVCEEMKADIRAWFDTR